MKFKFHFLIVNLFFTLLTIDAQITKVPVSGFNKDLIVNGTGAASSSVTSAFDASSFAFVAQDFPGVSTCYLPNSGIVNSALTAGLSFQLNSYSSNNAFHVTAATGSGVFTLNTPQPMNDLYVLWSSGQGSCVTDVTVTFSDLTTQVFSGITVADWFGSVASFTNIGSVNLTSGTVEPCASYGTNFFESIFSLLATIASKIII
ncbi:MAG: hypothetical protein NTU43_00660 [Bacteroidetes bacterium]|nr:hypothetical protein [Bacteroidota bacterium]